MKKWQKKVLISVIVVLILGVLSGLGYVFIRYRTAMKELEFMKTAKSEVSGVVPDADEAKMIEEISRIIELPQNETPAVAVVTDDTKLKNQPFFAPAKNGDWVLAYRDIKRVILYRPSVKKIIDVANAVFAENSENSDADGSGAEVTAKTSISIRNASGVLDSESTITRQLATVSDITISESTVSAGIRGSSLIVKTGNPDENKFQELVELLKFTVGEMPDSERPTEADVLILIGSDISE